MTAETNDHSGHRGAVGSFSGSQVVDEKWRSHRFNVPLLKQPFSLSLRVRLETINHV